MKYAILDRENFVEVRYIRFLAMKSNPIIQAMGAHYTNLDNICPLYNRTYADIVICDSCNEDIRELNFVMLEGQRVYHLACAAKYAWYKERTPTIPYENVIDILEWKNQSSKPPSDSSS